MCTSALICGEDLLYEEDKEPVSVSYALKSTFLEDLLNLELIIDMYRL